MKKQIITLIIGILIGAVITSAIFLIVKPKNGRNMPDFSQFNKDGEKFDPNNFKPGENRNRRSKDNTTQKDDNKVENQTEEKQNEKQG